MWIQRWWVTGERVAFLAVSGLILFGALHIQGEVTRHLIEVVVLGLTYMGLQEMSPRSASQVERSQRAISSVTDEINSIVEQCWQAAACPSDEGK